MPLAYLFFLFWLGPRGTENVAATVSDAGGARGVAEAREFVHLPPLDAEEVDEGPARRERDGRRGRRVRRGARPRVRVAPQRLDPTHREPEHVVAPEEDEPYLVPERELAEPAREGLRELLAQHPPREEASISARARGGRGRAT